jgi:hypothetical protein
MGSDSSSSSAVVVDLFFFLLSPTSSSSLQPRTDKFDDAADDVVPSDESLSFPFLSYLSTNTVGVREKKKNCF